MVAQSVGKSVARSVATAIDGAVGSGTIYLTEAQWEALTEYDLDATYDVAGVGVYEGATLVTPATWSYSGSDYHVTKSGNDSTGDGSFGNPWLTVGKAFTTVSAAGGRTIWVDTGTYSENLSATGYFFFTAKVFTSPVTIRGRPSTLPILQNTSGSYVFRCTGVSSNIRVQNMQLQGVGALSSVVACISGAAISNFELRDCTITNAASTAVSIDLTGTGGTSGVAIKRCTFTNAGAFGIYLSNHTGTNLFIGNTVTTTATNILALANGVYSVASNTLTTAIQMTGGTSRALEVVISGTTCANIVHTGGSATYKTSLDIIDCVVNAPTGVRGIAVSGYTDQGSIQSCTVTSLGDTGIGWPIDGGGNSCSGHSIVGNTVTNNGSNGHSILISTGGDGVTCYGNTTDASGGGNYGMVVKGQNNTVTGNTFRGGNGNGLVLKDCAECTVTGNTVYSSKSGAIGLEFAAGAITPLDNIVTGNTFYITHGSLYNQLLAQMDVGNIVNENIYSISGSGVWGSLFGTTINSLAQAQAAWAANYGITTNDNASTAI